jgi:hypothetical protein
MERPLQVAGEETVAAHSVSKVQSMRFLCSCLEAVLLEDHIRGAHWQLQGADRKTSTDILAGTHITSEATMRLMLKDAAALDASHICRKTHPSTHDASCWQVPLPF